jgi:nucleoside-diphosphate-sugar epimerase
VIHAAFVHDNFTEFSRACETDRHAIEALGKALAGSGRPLVITSGTALLPPGRRVTEDDAADPGSVAAPRVPSEGIALAMASHGVRASVMRLPPSVHGNGDHGFVPSLIRLAREKGVAARIGDGANRWPAVHRLDAARLFRLAVETAPAGSKLHAVGDEGIPFRDIAQVIGRRLDLPVVSLSAEDASGHFGWLAPFVAINNPASSTLTRERMAWHPEQPGLIQDLEEGRYFAN